MLADAAARDLRRRLVAVLAAAGPVPGARRPRQRENRTWVVRATTTGVSAVIDPRGTVRQQTPLFAPAVLDATIVPRRAETLYQRCGDWFAVACLLTTGVIGLVAVRDGAPDGRRRAHLR